MLLLGFSRFKGKLVKTFIPNDNSRKQAGFTLAEVLITLGIIGVVAAMTLPTLVQNYKKKTTVTKLQKAYNIVLNAIKLAEVENESISTWDLSDSENIMKNYIAKHIKYAKMYGSSPAKTPLCHEKQVTDFSGYTYGWFDRVGMYGPFDNENWSVSTPDGMCIGYGLYLKKPIFYIDINSSINPPNVAGKDLFFFYVVDGKLLGYGYDAKDADISNSSVTNSCHKKAPHGGGMCSTKIMRDGWTIKDDYPW